MKKEKRVVYLDQAATTFPKPDRVIRAVSDCLSHYCGNPGRGSHSLAVRSARKVYECRVLLGDMFGAQPENVIFTLNTTYAINMAIKGVMRGGGHMLISNMEHNSVLRPARQLQREGTSDFDIFCAYRADRTLTEEEILHDISSKIRSNTRLLFCTHASNICSLTLPIEKIGALCHEKGILFGVDGAQSAGHIPIDMRKMNIDILCLPAHKGLYGPQGCGMMILGDGVDPSLIRTLIEGGNGVNSLEDFMGDDLPERYEAGTVSTPSIAGLCEGIRFVGNYGVENVSRHCAALWRYAYRELSKRENIKIYVPEHPGSILLFNIDSLPSDEVGEQLNRRGICVRTGFHCSSLGHRTLGTPDSGAVRAGFGIFNSHSDVEALIQAVLDISGGFEVRDKKY